MRNKYFYLLLTALLVLALAVASCGEPPAENNSEAEPEAPVENNQEEEIDDNEKQEKPDEEEQCETVEFDLYFLEDTGTSFIVGAETHEFEGSKIGPEVLLERLLEGPQEEDLSRIIPEDTELLNASIEDGVAYVDFSKELTRAQVGSESEAVLVDSIVLTLTQLEDVDAVQILVEGEKVETIAGHVYIFEPLR